MHERPQDFSPIDPGRVNTMDPLELAWWAERLGCTVVELQAAVDAVGEHVTEIRIVLAERTTRQR